MGDEKIFRPVLSKELLASIPPDAVALPKAKYPVVTHDVCQDRISTLEARVKEAEEYSRSIEGKFEVFRREVSQAGTPYWKERDLNNSLMIKAALLTLNEGVLQDKCDALEEKMDRLRSILKTGLGYMREGKEKFAATTTNSRVDDWIKEVEVLL